MDREKEARYLSDKSTLETTKGAPLNDDRTYKLNVDFDDASFKILRVLPENYLRFARERNKEIKEEESSESKKTKPSRIFTRRGQIESFWDDSPFFYDSSKIFWMWDEGEKKWERKDEVDLLNSIQELYGIETINSKSKSELIEGFKQIGRKKIPEPMDKHWVQFKDKIYDVKTRESFAATPKYFITNPIPYKVGSSEETPTIDKYFSEWVEEKHKETLYQIIAYTICLNKFMQRIFALVGGGSNGKGTYSKLLKKFVGIDNCVSSEIRSLSENQFEPSVLYRKLLCIMGEVSQDDLRNTNMLKKIAGEDMLSFQFKGKDSFTDENTATCLCLTNGLPTTPDKTLGFYRKWLIIDFPNQFKEIKENLIDKIPEEEFENLAKKSLRILKELYDNPKFKNEGNFEERMDKYESHSNPVMRFVEQFCDENPGEMTVLRNFSNKVNEYLKINHLRTLTATQISSCLRKEGFEVGNRRIPTADFEERISARVILNLSINTQKLSLLSKLSIFQIDSLCNSISDLDSNDSNDSNHNKPLCKVSQFSKEDIEKSGLDPKLIEKTLQEISTKS